MSSRRPSLGPPSTIKRVALSHESKPFCIRSMKEAESLKEYLLRFGAGLVAMWLRKGFEQHGNSTLMDQDSKRLHNLRMRHSVCVGDCRGKSIMRCAWF